MKRDQNAPVGRDTPLTVGMLIDLLESAPDARTMLSKLRSMVESQSEREARELAEFEERHF
jgi:hypothetical protein